MQIFILQSRPSIPIRVKMQNVFGQCQDVTLESQIETNIPIFHSFHLKISLCLNWDIFLSQRISWHFLYRAGNGYNETESEIIDQK